MPLGSRRLARRELFIASRIAGGFASVAAGKALAARKTEWLFTGATVIAGGLYASGRGLMRI